MLLNPCLALELVLGVFQGQPVGSAMPTLELFDKLSGSCKLFLSLFIRAVASQL